MEANSIDRIREANFDQVRRGYDPQQVDRFLARVADWLESGGGDQARTEVLQREIERIGSRTAAILGAAEESAQQLRGDAEREASDTLASAESDARRVRGEADGYASEVRGQADSYAAGLRRDADDYAGKARADADEYSEKTHESANANAERKQALAEERAAEILDAAERKAKRIVDEGTRRRREIEKVIADLVTKRNATIAGTEELIEKLRAATAAHKPEQGADRFARPRELDPGEAAAEADNADAQAAAAERVEA